MSFKELFLSLKNKVEDHSNDRKFKFEINREEDRMILSILVFSSERPLPSSVVNYVKVKEKSGNHFFLKMDERNAKVFLIQKIPTAYKKLPFRSIYVQFAQKAESFRKTLDEIAFNQLIS